MRKGDKRDLSQTIGGFSRFSVNMRKTLRSTLDSSGDLRALRKHQNIERYHPTEDYLALQVYEKFNVTGTQKSKKISDAREETPMQSSTKRASLFVAKIVEVNSTDVMGGYTSIRQQRSMTKLPDPSNFPNLKKIYAVKSTKDDRIKELEQELREMKLKYARMVAIASEASGKHPDSLYREEPFEDDKKNEKQQETLKFSRMAGKVKHLLEEQQKIAESNLHLSKGSPG